jgi:quinol monooxygenase YgiN
MFVVAVEFSIKKGCVDDFTRAVIIQAGNSLHREPDCHRFDVCKPVTGSPRIFLYELYTNEAAFKAHQQTDHYARFQAAIKDWVKSKTVSTWELVQRDPASEDFVPIS